MLKTRMTQVRLFLSLELKLTIVYQGNEIECWNRGKTDNIWFTFEFCSCICWLLYLVWELKFLLLNRKRFQSVPLVQAAAGFAGTSSEQERPGHGQVRHSFQCSVWKLMKIIRVKCLVNLTFRWSIVPFPPNPEKETKTKKKLWAVSKSLRLG